MVLVIMITMMTIILMGLLERLMLLMVRILTVWSRASTRLLGTSHPEFQLDDMLLIHRWTEMILITYSYK